MNLKATIKSIPLLFLLSLFLAAPLSTNPLVQAHESNLIHSLSQDITRPEIYGWGIDGSVNTVDSFTVWANVTDTNSGILNVTAVIRVDANVSSTTRTLMPFNGTFFSKTFSALEINHTYSIWVEAYDMELNLAQSYNRQFDLHVYPSTGIDPNVTLPFVLTGSLVTFLVAVLLAREYQKRNPRLETPPVEAENI
ncbi:MAG: hypothetical protein ACFFED_17790 [Candidatus Thorarchaeota archaeon]